MFVAFFILAFGGRDMPQILFGILIEVIFVTFMALSALLRDQGLGGYLFAGIALLDFLLLVVLRIRYASSPQAEEDAIRSFADDNRDLFGERRDAEAYNAELVRSLDGIDPGPLPGGSPSAEVVPLRPLSETEEKEKAEIVERMRRLFPKRFD